jgi:hypothetical protein
LGKSAPISLLVAFIPLLKEKKGCLDVGPKLS